MIGKKSSKTEDKSSPSDSSDWAPKMIHEEKKTEAFTNLYRGVFPLNEAANLAITRDRPMSSDFDGLDDLQNRLKMNRKFISEIAEEEKVPDKEMTEVKTRPGRSSSAIKVEGKFFPYYDQSW